MTVKVEDQQHKYGIENDIAPTVECYAPSIQREGSEKYYTI